MQHYIDSFFLDTTLEKIQFRKLCTKQPGLFNPLTTAMLQINF